MKLSGKDKLDFAARAEVLEALIREYTGRLYAVQHPDCRYERIQHLRDQAAALLGQAEEIEASLYSDTCNVATLKDELLYAKVERKMITACLQQGIKPKRSLRHFVRIVIDQIRQGKYEFGDDVT